MSARSASCWRRKSSTTHYELENVWGAETTIHQSNPLGKVPCLMMEDGSPMYDSRVIAEYLDTLTPVCKLLPPNGRDRADVKVWEALADGVLDAAVLVRLEKTLRPPEQQSDDWIERQMGKVHAGLAVMSARPGRVAFLHGQPLHAGRRRRRLHAWAGCRSASPTSAGAATTRTWRACSTSCPSARRSATPCRKQ